MVNGGWWMVDDIKGEWGIVLGNIYKEGGRWIFY